MSSLICAASGVNRIRGTRYLSSFECGRLVGCSYLTIIRACESGDIQDFHRTQGGHYRVSVQSVCDFYGCPLPEDCQPEENGQTETGRVTILYHRVSSEKQRAEGNLQ